MMDRRNFLRNTAVVSGGVLLAPSLISASGTVSDDKKLTILHTNDTHSNIDPFPSNHAKYPGQGGVARRYELIQKIRQEEKHVLLLDAGDIFQGTPYFNKYGGMLEMRVMSELGYDAATMGNHDFDAGLEGFLDAQNECNFPFLCSNYDFNNTDLEGITSDELVLEKGDIKVGLFGLGVELKGLVPDSKYGETKYLDPVGIAQDKVASLQKQKCDLIICLSHLGYEYGSDKISDRLLAQKTSGIHLIIGGHTHTFLERPTEEKNRDDDTVLINQVGWAGVQLGRVDFEFEKQKFSKKDVMVVQ